MVITGSAKEEWLSKPDAAKLLGVQYRQLEKRVEQGFIQKQVLDGPGGQRVVFSRPDIEAFISGFPNRHPPVRIQVPKRREKANAAAIVPAPDGLPALIRSIAEEIQRQSAVRDIPVQRPEPQRNEIANAAPSAAFPPWLDIYQAALYSNLTPAFLRRHARTGLLHVIDIGPAPGGRLRFNRDALSTLGTRPGKG